MKLLETKNLELLEMHSLKKIKVETKMTSFKLLFQMIQKLQNMLQKLLVLQEINLQVLTA